MRRSRSGSPATPQSARLAVLALIACCSVTPGRGGCYDLQPRCDVLLVNTQIADNGDGDGFADTNETLRIGLTLETRNCETPPAHCVARLSTDSPAVDCLPRAELFIGSLPATGPPVTPEERFEVKFGDVDRQSLGLGPDDVLEASFRVEFDCADAEPWLAREFTLPIDLNVSDLGQTPTPWFEGFEGGTLGRFHAQNNDAGIPGTGDSEGLQNAEGWRCQYTDPSWTNSSSYNNQWGDDCYPGINLGHADAVFWQIDGSSIPDSPDGGRARSGVHSMYYGVFLNHPMDGFSSPLSVVEAAGTTDPVHLGVDSPQLSFWQQISLLDSRTVQAPDRRSADRAVLQIQLADPSGNSTTPWMNLQAVQNNYDQQAADNFFNCTFDPIDDGNNEADFFDPDDPDRELGPSSTCYPEYSWAWMGNTSPGGPHIELGHAATLPGTFAAGSLGDGTWIETLVDLSAFRGRSARFRYLVSAIKYDTSGFILFDLFGDINERDDGWWIDDVQIDETLEQPAEFTNDRFLLGSCSGTGVPCIEQCRTSLESCSASVPCGDGAGDCVMPCAIGEVCTPHAPDCGADCSEVQANLLAEPAGQTNPQSVSMLYGDEVCLNAAASSDAGTGAEPSRADACIGGYLEYRFCVSGDPDGPGAALADADCDDAWDEALPAYPWSLEFVASLSPELTTTYAMEVRCSSVPGCRDSASVEVVVACPGGSPNTSGLKGIRALDKDLLFWNGVLDVDWLRGSFVSSSEIGSYTEDFSDFSAAVTSIPMSGEPAVGAGYYFLVKADGVPNPFFSGYDCDTVTWRSGGAAEQLAPPRDVVFGDP